MCRNHSLGIKSRGYYWTLFLDNAFLARLAAQHSTEFKKGFNRKALERIAARAPNGAVVRIPVLQDDT
jgi:hypothetical protein